MFYNLRAKEWTGLITSLDIQLTFDESRECAQHGQIPVRAFHRVQLRVKQHCHIHIAVWARRPFRY